MKTNLSQEGAATPSKKDRFDKKNVNVRVNPFINFQIGLVAALLFAIVVIEMTSEEILPPERVIASTDSTEDDDWENKRFKMVPNKPIEKKQKPKPKKDIPPKVVEDNTPEPEPDPEPTPEPTPVEPITQVTEGEPVDNAPVTDQPVKNAKPKGPISTTMDGLDSMPLFPGCESLDNNEERRSCFNDKMKRFVNRKFDTGIARDIDMEEGETVKIIIVFTINSKGYPENVKVKAPHPLLEKEAYRLIGKLPRITPGKVGGKAVNVFFQLPINFRVSD